MGGEGEGPVTSFKVNFNFPKFQGVQHIYYPGGGGRQTFFQGGGVQLLSDRTYNLYWTPIHGLDPPILIDYGDSLCLFSSFIMYPPRCMFYSNLKV